jgi:hypothetical protein
MNSIDFNEGDILWATKHGEGEGIHPIIYLGEIDEFYFLGGMITHSSDYGNVALQDAHFKSKGSLDKRPQFFVPQFLKKKEEWGPFEFAGCLNHDGISYVLASMKNTDPISWEQYKPNQ